MTTKVDGSTGVDLIKDGTVVQQDLAAGVVGNGPAFNAYQTGTGQGLASSVKSVLILTDKLFDTANAFTVGATPRFQPSVAGYYQLQAAVGVSAGTALYDLFCAIDKNGQETVRGSRVYDTNTYGQHGGSVAVGLVYLNGTSDYANVTVYATGTGGLTTNASLHITNFSGFLARAA